MLSAQPKRVPVAARVGTDRRLTHHRATASGNNRTHVHVTVRVDANNEVHLVCEHARTSSLGWGQTGAGLET